MADEDKDSKTEEATSKRKQDALKDGNVPKSAEVSGAGVIVFSTVYLLFFATPLFSYIQKMMIYTYSFIDKGVESKVYLELVDNIIFDLLGALLPFFLIVLFSAIAFNLVQFGFVAAPIKFELNKINPISGMKNVFSMKKLLEALKLIAKLIVIFIVMVILLSLVWDSLLSMMNKDIRSSIDSMITLTIYFLLTILFIIVIFAFIDLVFVRKYYFDGLKMSKEEIKKEHKNIEGDPLVKQRIRQIQYQMSQQRMTQDIKEADVVITNPTHYAVALRYKQDKDHAPKVMVKGVDLLATRIKEIALKYDVRIIEDPHLARMLYEQVEEHQDIPVELYSAVANVFKYINKMNQQGDNKN